ncbi:MAG: nuclear transport factor 2 family protein [Sphingomonadaceae bacterium]
MNDTQANCRVFERYIEAFNSNDVDGWMGVLTDDFRLRGKGMPPSGIDHNIGKEDLCQNMTRYREQFRQTIHLTIDSIVCDGDRLAAECYSGAVLADGSTYANQYSFHVRFRDGLIAEMNEYCCTYTVKSQLRESGVGIGIEA